MFQEALQFRFCHYVVLHQIDYHEDNLLSASTSDMVHFQIIVDCLSLVLSNCVYNKSHEHWLLNDALHFAISMNLKLKKEN
jgi:hypothetical protein